MMKKILLVCLLGVFALSAGAQEVAKKPSFKGFVNNGFWDNWEISVAGGANYIGYDGIGLSGQDNMSDCIGWTRGPGQGSLSAPAIDKWPQTHPSSAACKK